MGLGQLDAAGMDTLVRRNTEKEELEQNKANLLKKLGAEYRKKVMDDLHKTEARLSVVGKDLVHHGVHPPKEDIEQMPVDEEGGPPLELTEAEKRRLIMNRTPKRMIYPGPPPPPPPPREEAESLE